MRRTNQEFKEEILRREAAYRAVQKRKRKKLLSAALCVVLVLGGLRLAVSFIGFGGSTECAVEENGAQINYAGSGNSADMESAQQQEAMDVCPAVMIEGVLYFDTGYYAEDGEACGLMDGEITSAVDGSQLPSEDDQSNFGVGYGYQYGETEGTVEVYINSRWKIFATEKVKDQMSFLEE